MDCATAALQHKEYFELAFHNLCECAEASFEKNDDEEQQRLITATHHSIHTCLHTLLDYYERLRKTETFVAGEELKSYMLAFRLANNKLKHITDLVNVAVIEDTFCFPIMFPMRFDMGYYWGNMEKHISEKRPNDALQYEHYKQRLQGSEVRCTFLHVKKLLERM